MKKKIVIVSGVVAIIIAVLIFLAVYSSRTNKVDNAVNNKEYLFFLKNEKDTPYSEVSVLNNSKVIELGQTALDEVYTLNNEGAFLLVQEDSTSKKDYNLVVVNKDRSEKVVGTISKEFLHSIECIDGYIYYEEVSKDNNGNIVKSIVEVNPRVDGKVFPKIVLSNMDTVLYSNDKRVLGTNLKDELISYDRKTKKEEIIGQMYTSKKSGNEVILLSSNGEITYYNLETGEKIVDSKRITNFSGKAKELYTTAYKDGSLIYYTYNGENSNTKQLYIKSKDSEPILISSDVSDIQVIDDNIIYTKDIKNGNKLEHELIETNIKSPSESRVLLKSEYIKMQYKAIDLDGSIYAIVGNDSELCKITKDGEIEKLNDKVNYVGSQKGQVIYYKSESQANNNKFIHNVAYEIYIGNKLVAKDVHTLYMLNGNIAYRDGNNLNIIEDAQVQKLNVDMSKYDTILENDGMTDTLHLDDAYLDGYWKIDNGYKVEYIELQAGSMGGLKVISEKTLDGKKYNSNMEYYKYELVDTSYDKAKIAVAKTDSGHKLFGDLKYDSVASIEMVSDKEFKIDGKKVNAIKISKEEYENAVSKILTKESIETIAKKSLQTNEVKFVENKDIKGQEYKVFESVLKPNNKIIIGKAGSVYDYNNYIQSGHLMLNEENLYS